jgi:hypothetical protein
MPSKKRNASQARKDRAALKRLQKSGTYRGKIDLRKAPSDYQLKKIRELKENTRSRKQPLPPKTKTPGAKVKRTRMSAKELKNVKVGKHKLVTYALPFLRKGQREPEWRRFTAKGLNQFLNEYKADDPEGKAKWKEYAVREEWTFETKTERTDFRHEADLYFSGRRIDEPNGVIRKVHANQHTKKKRARKRGSKK